MKSHELAKALSTLSDALRQSENTHVEDIRFQAPHSSKYNKDAVPVALSTLVAMSKFGKSEWLDIIRLYNFPVEIRPRDASRDILGKILKHLEESPEARQRLATQATKSTSDTSPELLNALQLLLRK